MWADVALAAHASKSQVLSPAEAVFLYCEHNLWLTRLAYDTAQANHLVYTLRKAKDKLSTREQSVMQNLLTVAYKSVADDMAMVAKLGLQSRKLTSSLYFAELQAVLGTESVSALRQEFGRTMPKELRSWKSLLFRRHERCLVKDVENCRLKLLYWQYIFTKYCVLPS